ncbi:hypothetical protein [Saccharicrinis aurantiacus]|uniref:hypothetical protein n=1 Tax=Saccharicrinis aurantiacus TaxID=1849719 RepID=UPI00248FD632|nr:hypothetical protein [Saccharicrinis aurantiacus]
MNKYDKTHIIYLKVGDVDTIRVALKQYQTLLNSREVICVTEGIWDVIFVDNSGEKPRHLNISDTKNIELLREAMSITSEKACCMTPEFVAEEDTFESISEPILFAMALEYPELKEELVTTAKAIVACSRHYNSVSNLWTDDLDIYGADALYMLARTDLNYAYLLSLFFTRCWDGEQDPEYSGLLFDLVKRNGWCRELIKAYIYCDSATFRMGMFRVTSYGRNAEEDSISLGDYLKANPDEYSYFKQTIKERFEDEPMLYWSNWGGDETEPILEIYKGLGDFENSHDKNEEPLQLHFIEDTLENEAMDLQKKLEAELDTPLISLSATGLKQQEVKKYTNNDNRYYGDGVMEIREFILALDNGDQLWEYVETGNQKDSLGALEEIDVLGFAQKHSPKFYHRTNSRLMGKYGNAKILEWMHYCSNDIQIDLIRCDNETFSVPNIPQAFNPPLAERKTVRLNQALRMFDILFILLGKQTFSAKMCKVFTDKEGSLINQKEFYKRYSVQEEVIKEYGMSQRQLNLLKDIIQDLGSSGYMFPRFRDIFKDLISIVSEAPAAGRPSMWGVSSSATMLMAVVILNNDQEQGTSSEYTNDLYDYITERSWKAAFNGLARQDEFSDPVDATLFATVENYICNPGEPSSSKKEIVEILNQIMPLDEVTRYRYDYTFPKFSEKQKSYSALCPYVGTVALVTIFSFFAQKLPQYNDPRAQRFWDLIVALAPHWAISIVTKALIGDSHNYKFKDHTDQENYFQSIMDSGVDAHLLLGYQLSRFQGKFTYNKINNVDEYLQWLQAFSIVNNSSEGDPMAMMYKERVDALKRGLPYLDDSNRIRFYHDLAMFNPTNVFDHDDELERCLRYFVCYFKAYKATSGLEELSVQMMKYIKGEVSYTDIEPQFSSLISEDLESCFPEWSMMSLAQFFMAMDKERQDRLLILLLNHTAKGYAVISDVIGMAYQDDLIREGELKLISRLENPLTNKKSEAYCKAQAAFIQRVEGLGVNQVFLVRFCINSATQADADYLAKLSRRGQLSSIIDKLNFDARENLINLWENQSGKAKLLESFLNDPSRLIRDRAAQILEEISVEIDEEEPTGSHIVDYGNNTDAEETSTVVLENASSAAFLSSYDSSGGKYFLLKPTIDDLGIDCSQGEEHLESSSVVSLLNPVEFDAYGYTHDKLTDYIGADYTLVSPGLAAILAQVRALGCHFIPAVVNTSDDKSERYYALKAPLFAEDTAHVELPLQSRLLFLTGDSNKAIVCHHTAIDIIKENMGELSGFTIEEV